MSEILEFRKEVYILHNIYTSGIMTYKEILHFNKNDYKEAMVTDVAISFILNYISPIFTKFFLKTKITPNQLTICMILSGVTGAILFCIPMWILKIIGVIFIWLWFIFDHCDGEVARIKKQFSKFGKEIDYCAHVINHPLFAFSFMCTIIQYTGDYKLCILFFVIIAFNLAYRFLNCINVLYQYKMKEGINTTQNCDSIKISNTKRYLIFVINMFVHFPNYALIFPIICLLNFKIALLYTCIVLIFNLIYVPYLFFDFVRTIKNL